MCSGVQVTMAQHTRFERLSAVATAFVLPLSGRILSPCVYLTHSLDHICICDYSTQEMTPCGKHVRPTNHDGYESFSGVGEPTRFQNQHWSMTKVDHLPEGTALRLSSWQCYSSQRSDAALRLRIRAKL
jgi:hypothetical protein